jgi:hypothetical protein
MFVPLLLSTCVVFHVSWSPRVFAMFAFLVVSSFLAVLAPLVLLSDSLAVAADGAIEGNWCHA